uniref:DNA-directed RNA polymerase subunit N n=1 Tax=viral metagenome TaxID=1070528 RepID=A0A6C0HPB7_9ZZZZ
MIIPVKCFTCGTVLADKYRWYQAEVRKLKIEESGGNSVNVSSVLYLTKTQTEKTPEGKVMDILGLNKMCCRRHILTHVDIE